MLKNYITVYNFNINIKLLISFIKNNIFFLFNINECSELHRKSNISRYVKFFFFKPDETVENKQFNTFTYILPTWSTLKLLYSFSLKLIPFCCSSARLVYFCRFLRSAFSAYERYIEVTRRCMHFVSGIFLCAGNEENNIPLYPVLYLSLSPAPSPLIPPLLLSRVQFTFFRFSFVLFCGSFFEICANRD